MRLVYSTHIGGVEIEYRYAPGRSATREDPPEDPVLEVDAVWLLDQDQQHRVLDILGFLKPGMFEQLFGKYIDEAMSEQGSDEYQLLKFKNRK